jgi:hypothetical protein
MIHRSHLRSLPLALALVCTAAAGARAGEVQDLVRKADNAYRGDTAAGVFTMEVKTSSYQRSYKVVSWQDTRGADRALVKILGPALWRGYGTLKVGRQLKLFNPRSNHVTVVSHSMLGDSWMGSHFTNDDLVHETNLADDYEVSLDGKRRKGDAILYRIRMTPRPSAPVAWHHIEYTLSKTGDRVLPLEARYFRRADDERPTRTLTFSDVGELGGRQLPRKMTVTVADKPGEYTRITYNRLRLDVNIPASKFSEQALRH